MTSLTTLLDQPLVHRLSWTLIHSLWQLIALALLAAGLLAALHRRPSNTRYLAACAMLVAMLLTPLITFALLTSQRATLPTPRYIQSEPITAAIIPADTEPAAITPLPTPPLPDSPTRFLPYLVPLYFAGIFTLSLLHLGGWLQIQRMRRTHVKPVDPAWRAALAQLAIQLRVRRSVQLLESTLVHVPAVVGLFRPVILLPTTVLTGLTPQQIKSILAHELAHIRRHDYLANLVQTAIETLLFYHPAAWWLSDRIRQERENCCDDLAAAACADRVEYAGALAAMEELRGVGAPHLALAARGGSLLRRIRRLLNVPDPSRRRGPSLLAAGAAVACVLLAALSLNGQSKDGDAAAKDKTAAAAKDDGAAGAAGGPAAAIKPEDLKVLNEDYTIAPGDLVSVTITDLAGPGKETVRTMRVSAAGVISLPFLSVTDANGLTEHELEQLVRKKYQAEGIVQQANVSVAVVEARARSFSILGQVNKPGQYALHDPDYRLLNAIAQAEGTKDGAVVARVLRKPKPVPGEEQPRGRTFDVPLKPLLEGDTDLNVVIRPGDTIVVTAPKPHAVRLVVGKDSLAYEGRPTTWEELTDLLKKIPQAQRGNTTLELAVESADVIYGRVLAAQFNASRLVKEHGLANLSLVGIHSINSKGGDAPPADENVYISGVKHTGAYTITPGRKITLKQLVVSAGGPEAPVENSLVTLIRRHGPDKEEVLLRDVPLDSVINGKQEDVALQPQDIIQVKSKVGDGNRAP